MSHAVELWSERFPHDVNTLAYASKYGLLFVGCSNQEIYCYNEAGDQIWSHEAPSRVWQLKAADNHLIGAIGAEVMCLDFRGTQLWQFETDGGADRVAISGDGKRAFASSSIYDLEITDYKDGIIYFLEDGKIVGEFNTEARVWDLACSAAGDLLIAGVGHPNKKVYAFTGSGEKLWTYETGNSVISVSVDAEGKHIMAASRDGKLYCLDREGNEVWTWDSESNLTGVTMDPGARLTLVSTEKDTAVALNRNGKLLWTVDMEMPITHLDVDTEGTRAVVAAALIPEDDEGERQGAIRCLHGDGQAFWEYNRAAAAVGAAIDDSGRWLAAIFEDRKVLTFDNKVIQERIMSGRHYTFADEREVREKTRSKISDLREKLKRGTTLSVDPNEPIHAHKRNGPKESEKPGDDDQAPGSASTLSPGSPPPADTET